MGQRKSNTTDIIKQYKYASYIECEEKQDKHRYAPKTWPPRRMANTQEEPSVSGRCIDCGVNLTVYLGHALGEMQGIEVILPEAK